MVDNIVGTVELYRTVILCIVHSKIVHAQKHHKSSERSETARLLPPAPAATEIFSGNRDYAAITVVSIPTLA